MNEHPTLETQNTKLKTTFLTGEYPPMQGGIADHITYLAEYMSPLDIDSSILISCRWKEAGSSIQNSKLYPELGRRVKIQNSNIHPILPNWGWRCWPAIDKFLSIHRPDVLHIQYQAAAFDLGGWVNWIPWYLKKWQRTPTKIVTTFHDLRIPYIFPKAGPFRWKSMLALARHSDAVICTNREDLVQLEMSNEQLSKLTVIPLGSNVEPQPPDNFERDEWRSKNYRIHNDTLLLAYFGFLNESKGGEELIEALALLRQQEVDAHLLFIGGDVGHADPTNVAYAQKVQALIDRHNLNPFIHRSGYVELPEVSAHLLAADAVVMPYRDGVSFRRTTLIAALRHGCPVVSTTPANPALIPEIKPRENMLLAPPQNAMALAETIASLTYNAELLHQLSRGAKALGDLFNWNTIAQDTADLYRAIC